MGEGKRGRSWERGRETEEGEGRETDERRGEERHAFEGGREERLTKREGKGDGR